MRSVVDGAVMVMAVVLAVGLALLPGRPATAAVLQAGSSAEVADATSCPCSIWSPTAAPSNVTAAPSNVTAQDSNAVEIGVKFRSDVDGFVAGVRFYKGPQNTGTHVGNLWSTLGQRLATATFSNETGSGWQEVGFDAPVPVAANTTYVASYHTTSGYYSGDRDFFTATGVESPPLRALADDVSGGNGVYSHSPSSTFPSSTSRATNYWVDVTFTTTTTPTTTTPDDHHCADDSRDACGCPSRDPFGRCERLGLWGGGRWCH